MIRTGLTLALTAGIVDVSIALLQRPEGFSRLTALPAPILALAALVFAVFVPAAWLARQAARPAHRDAAATSLALFAGVTLTIALLSGVPLDPTANAHTLYKLALSLGIGAALGIATFAALGARAGEAQRGRAPMLGIAARALPLLGLEVLLFEWTAIFQVDPLFSAAGVLLAGALGIVVLATLAIYLSAARTRAADWGLAACIVALAVTPLGARWPASGVSVSAPVSAQGVARVPRRIILISVDTLRADAVSAYRGGSGRPTPAIDALAADGVRFEHAYAPAPWTLPSLVSLVTGVAPSVHHTVGFDARLDGSATTLAERLSGRGYYTSAIVHNDLLSPIRNLAQGFDHYQELFAPWSGESLGASLLHRLSPARFPDREWPSTADHTQLVLDWLDRNQSRDFFLWVHYFDPHAPYAPPLEYLAGEEPAPGIGAAFEGQKLTMEGFVVTNADQRRWIRSLYDAETRYVDASIGRLLASLKQRSLYDDALIVFTADHGEEFWEHGSLGHGHSMYQELLRVPLIMKLPASQRRSVQTKVVAAPVSTVSVTPTLLDVAGVPYSPREMSAASLAPALDGAPVDPTPIVSTAQMLFDRRETVLFDRYRYIVSTLDGRVELYDHATDPGEQRSIAESSPELVARGAALLATHAADARALARRLGLPYSTHEVDEATLRRLRSLGYVK